MNRDLPGKTAALVREGDRIDSIDVLRGVSVLAILLMNIQSFSMVDAAYFNPTVSPWFEGGNRLVWQLERLFIDQKFMTIFSMLFGVGVFLFTARKEESGRPFLRLHYRRTIWLVVFGMLHAYLLWDGDILYAYGMCGLWVVLLRNRRPRVLLALSAVLITIPSILTHLYLMAGRADPSVVQGFLDEMWAPPANAIAEQIEVYRSGWIGQMPHRAAGALAMQTVIFGTFVVWRSGALMLAGMAFYKLGVFSASLSGRVYTAMAGGGFTAGLAIGAMGIRYTAARSFEGAEAALMGTQFNYWGSVFVAIGWVGLIMLVCQLPGARKLTRPFAAAGRMAFSNYIGQTVIGTWIFYGHGMGMFHRIDRVGQLGIVAVVWVLQLYLSMWWLRRFRFGPLEWLWRSLTYGHPAPLRRIREDVAGGWA